MVTRENFVKITQLVIDYVEGGYYHPSMLKKFNAKSQAILKDSGETMFGIDRKAGIQLSKFTEWEKFWNIIDNDRRLNPNLWEYQYRGGRLHGILKTLAAEIMYKWFTYLSNKYILIGSMDEIAADPRLLAHFSYAAWNGEGWFKRYAKALNDAIVKYAGDKEAIFKAAFDERAKAVKYIKGVKTMIPNIAIRQQAINMRPIFEKIKNI